MTNLTEDGEYLLAKNQSEHQKPSELKPYKKQYLAEREKKYFEKNEIGKLFSYFRLLPSYIRFAKRFFRLFVMGTFRQKSIA